jgi:hypothetical protein
MTRIARWAILAAVWALGSQPAPALDAASEPKTVAPADSSSPIGRDDNWTKWIALPEIAPYFDLHWRPFNTDPRKNAGGDGLRSPRDASPTGASTNPIERFSLGNSYLEIQTQKGLQDPFRQRTDCATDDECAEHSGVPKPQTPANKKSLKNLQRPFIGLSVTTPIE